VKTSGNTSILQQEKGTSEMILSYNTEMQSFDYCHHPTAINCKIILFPSFLQDKGEGCWLD
jgi:hypothetical protein